MGAITTSFATAWRDFATAGVMASGLHEPLKGQIREIGPLIETALARGALGGLVQVTYATRAALDADLAHPPGTVGLVTADAIDANNDIYTKTGISGAGSWTLGTAFHDILQGIVQPQVNTAAASAITAQDSASIAAAAQAATTTNAAAAAASAATALAAATASARYFSSQAAGEAGSATGQFFSHPDGAGGLVYREKTGGGSIIIANAATVGTLAASSGAAGIGSIRAETGAVAMTMEARVRQQYALPGDFGIVGTQVGGGVQNDAIAFAKFTAAGGTLLIPRDFTMRIATARTSAHMTAPFNVIGASRDTSEAFLDVDGVAIRTTNSAARSQWDNLTLRGNLAHANGAGLDLFDNSSRALSRLNVHRFNQVGLQATQSGTPIFNDIRGYDCGTGLKIDPGATASFSPIIRDYYFTGFNGVPGPRTSTALRLVGNCINPVVQHPIIEYCLYAIHATSILNVSVTNPDYEDNTEDHFGADAIFDVVMEQSTATRHTVSWTGAFEAYKRFLWKSSPSHKASGGCWTAAPRTVAAANIWYGLLLEQAMPSPYVNPNPGGAASDTVQILTPGVYVLDLRATFATAAAAGWGNIRLLKNGVEIPGGFGEAYVPAIAGASNTAHALATVEFAGGDTLKMEFGASHTDLRVSGRYGGNGPAPTSSTSARLTIRHLGATGALTL